MSLLSKGNTIVYDLEGIQEEGGEINAFTSEIESIFERFSKNEIAIFLCHCNDTLLQVY
jgi:hypothetical protein